MKKQIMQERHTNREKYFNEQSITTKKYVIPFLSESKILDENTSVLEIGCGEGGNLVPFVEAGCKRIVGVDLSGKKIENAIVFYDNLKISSKVTFINDDIYNIDPEHLGQFDVIIMRDVLEHIHGQEKFLNFAKKLLKPDGVFFISFPPWCNPFGGHQQMCKSKILSFLPYFHILPAFLYKFILKSFGEEDDKITGLIEIKDTAISIERFQRIIKKENYKIVNRIFYFINPNYEIKFNLKKRKVWKAIELMPYIRNFFITTNYYSISLNQPTKD